MSEFGRTAATPHIPPVLQRPLAPVSMIPYGSHSNVSFYPFFLSRPPRSPHYIPSLRPQRWLHHNKDQFSSSVPLNRNQHLCSPGLKPQCHHGLCSPSSNNLNHMPTAHFHLYNTACLCTTPLLLYTSFASKLDDCRCLLHGFPSTGLQNLQYVRCSAAPENTSLASVPLTGSHTEAHQLPGPPHHLQCSKYPPFTHTPPPPTLIYLLHYLYY